MAETAARRGRHLILPAVAVGAVLTIPILSFPAAASTFAPAALAVLALAAIAFLGYQMSPTTLACLGIAAEVFAGGNSRYLGLPIGPDRILFAAMLVALIRDRHRFGPLVRIRVGLVHMVMAGVVVYAVLNAFWAHTLQSSVGFFAILDRLGIIPFALFALSPLLFRTERQRNALLATLVTVGMYLAVISCLEILGPKSLIWPRYINNPAIGLHFGRARGPFLEAVANGLVLFESAVAACIAYNRWKLRWARAVAAGVAVLCVPAMLLTLTRAVWLAAVVAGVAVMVTTRTLRRVLFAGGTAAAVGLAIILIAVPSVGHRASARASDQKPVWDRLNTDAAAVAVVKAHPLFGIGWERFTTTGQDYLRQSDTMPLTGDGIEVHNVFLSHAAELGLTGFGLWGAAVVLAVGAAITRRTGPELRPWRLGAAAVAINWLTVATFGPLGYPLPNLLLWLFAGIVLAPAYAVPAPSVPPSPGRPAAADTLPPALAAV